ncbi:MAG: hypothetical protein MHM6MM_003695 [Cercozoa sp. M6MM]
MGVRFMQKPFVACNSGASVVQVIKVLRGRQLGNAKLGGTVKVAVKQARTDELARVKRSQMVRATVTTDKFPTRRKDGTHIRSWRTGVVLIDDKDKPLSDVVNSPVSLEAAKKFPKIGQIALKCYGVI